MISKDKNKKATFVFLYIAIGFVVGGILMVPLFSWLPLTHAPTFETNGQIGDFVGGVLNPIIALLALVWLKKGVELQQTELGETRQALLDANKNQELSIQLEVLKGRKDIIAIEISMIRDDIGFFSSQRDINSQASNQAYFNLLGGRIDFEEWRKALDTRRNAARDKIDQIMSLQKEIEELAKKLNESTP